MQSTATRRLVKSPPELWAELSSEDSLGRHLAEFGEIRITRVEPESTVAWEGDRASGTVELTPTGWGTKVLLTATPAPAPPGDPPPEAAIAAPVAAEVRPAAELRADATQEPPVRPAPSPEAPAATAVPAAEPHRIVLRTPPERPAPAPVPEAKRGFFARLFRKRQPKAAAPASSIPAPPAPGPDPAPPTPTPGPAPIPPPAPDPVPPTPAPQPPPPPQIEVLDPERTVAILTEVLDDLGAAHHRPFSRD